MTEAAVSRKEDKENREQQDSHKDSQEQDKRCGDQFKYQSHRFDPFLSFFLPIFYLVDAGATML